MTLALNVSIVIVSRERPDDLARVLTSLRFLQYPTFEVIVVTRDDPKALFPEICGILRIKFVPFDNANISAARNLGIAHAAGEIIAFCDDDAVPEPSWLTHLIAPFCTPDVGAAGGFVRGRNGISFQWKGRSIDRLGRHEKIEPVTDKPVILVGNREKAIKTEGTNCAFRKSALLLLGGFDENFRYFLDESDLNMRLGMAGWKTAIVPLAEVHHGFSKGPTRTARRAPRSLFEIGASKAYYCRKHAPTDSRQAEFDVFEAMQRKRLIKFMLRGDIEPMAVNRILTTLAVGLKDGTSRQSKPTEVFKKTTCPPFRPFRGGNAPVTLIALACRPAAWRRKRPAVMRAASQGVCVTVFRFSPTSFFHKMQFHRDGYWVQTGGQFGRSERSASLFRWFTLKSRARAEIARLQKVRRVGKISNLETIGIFSP